MPETPGTAEDWNVIVTLPDVTFREARKFLRGWGEVPRAGYFHALTPNLTDVESVLAEVGARPGWLIMGTEAMRAARRHGEGSLGFASDLHGREG